MVRFGETLQKMVRGFEDGEMLRKMVSGFKDGEVW